MKKMKLGNLIQALLVILALGSSSTIIAQTIYNQNGGQIQPGQNPASTNVGINEENPQYGLHIGGQPDSPTLMLDGNWRNAVDNHGRLFFNDRNFGIGAGNFGPGGDDDMYLWTFKYDEYLNRDIRFMTTSDGSTSPTSPGWRTNMILKSTGELGIGIVNPWSQLQVMGSRNNDFVTFSNNHPYVLSAATVIFGGYSAAQPVDTNPMLLQLYGNNTKSAYDRFRVFNNGEVAIGHVDLKNGYKLFVEEGILTEKLKVSIRFTSDWSDYVFDPAYERMTLNEVEKFVTKNKHLPGVPSAVEMVENGLNVAEMDATLLRQIEEIWLHVIDLKKEIKTLKSENTALKAK